MFGRRKRYAIKHATGGQLVISARYRPSGAALTAPPSSQNLTVVKLNGSRVGFESSTNYGVLVVSPTLPPGVTRLQFEGGGSGRELVNIEFGAARDAITVFEFWPGYAVWRTPGHWTLTEYRAGTKRTKVRRGKLQSRSRA
jgi:hypothetical protein